MRQIVSDPKSGEIPKVTSLAESLSRVLAACSKQRIMLPHHLIDEYITGSC